MIRASCHCVVMSVSSEADPEGGEGSVWVAGVAAQGGREVDRPRPAERPDGEAAQDRHDVWGGAGADLGGVLTEVTSRMWCSASMAQCPRSRSASRAGRANSNGRLVIA